MGGDIAAELVDRRHVAGWRNALGFEVGNEELKVHHRARNLPGRKRLAARMGKRGRRKAEGHRRNGSKETRGVHCLAASGRGGGGFSGSGSHIASSFSKASR